MALICVPNLYANIIYKITLYDSTHGHNYYVDGSTTISYADYWFNTSQVTSIVPERGGLTIFFTDGTRLEVNGDLEAKKIMNAIAQHQANGYLDGILET